MLDKNIIIEKMKQKDVNEVVSMGLSTEELYVEDKRPLFYTKKQLSKLVKSPKDLCLIARYNNEVIGFIINLFNPYLGDLYLSDIAVKPEFRNKGVGSALFEKSKEMANGRGSDWFWFLVHEDNKNMQEFAEKKGFKRGRKFYFYYKEL